MDNGSDTGGNGATPEAKYGTTETGAMRASIGTKICTSRVPYELVAYAALSLNYGANKYEERNFEKGLSYSSLLESAKRHIAAIENREPVDVDSGLPHEAMLAASVAMLCHNVAQKVIIDDRPIAKTGLDIATLALYFGEIENNAKPGGTK